jgi:tetratricopeptide (TPR) repeat protein
MPQRLAVMPALTRGILIFSSCYTVRLGKLMSWDLDGFYSGLKDYPEALSHLKKARESCTDCRRVDGFLGRVYTAMGNYREAEKVIARLYPQSRYRKSCS